MQINSGNKLGFGCKKCVETVDTVVNNGSKPGVAFLYVFDRVRSDASTDANSHRELARDVYQTTRNAPKAAVEAAENHFRNKASEYTRLLQSLINIGIEKGKALIFLLAGHNDFNANDTLNQRPVLNAGRFTRQAQKSLKIQVEDCFRDSLKKLIALK